MRHPHLKVWLPLPDRDFDVTEVAVPWRLLADAGHEVVFATESGGPARCDPLVYGGVLFGQLGAEPEPKRFYDEMVATAPYQRPARWDAMIPEDYDAIWLPGGHAPGMRPYLESAALQARVRAFWALKRPTVAICHGVLVPARAGVLGGVRSTCLPRYMELIAWSITAWKLGSYYRTYPETVQAEVIRHGARFERGPVHLFARGTAEDDGPAFVVEDGHYLSGRWPGDAYLLTKRLIARLR